MIINRAKVEVKMTIEQYERMRWAAFRRHMSMSGYCCQVISMAADADYAAAVTEAEEFVKARKTEKAEEEAQ